MIASIVPLQAMILGLVALAAPAVVVCRDPMRQIVVSGVFGLLLVVLFVVLQAPDVALSMLVVTTVGYPLVVLVAITRVRAAGAEEEQGAEEDDGEGEGQ